MLLIENWGFFFFKETCMWLLVSPASSLRPFCHLLSFLLPILAGKRLSVWRLKATLGWSPLRSTLKCARTLNTPELTSP